MLLCLTLAICVALAPVSDAQPGSNPASQLIISELCAKNDSILADNQGKFRDYIEIHNTGDTIDLTGYTITDGKNTSNPLDGIVLESGAYRVFFLALRTLDFLWVLPVAIAFSCLTPRALSWPRQP